LHHDSKSHRCRWANPANPLYLAYHDTEWGVPCHDELRLFEMLNLEGAQAGLSWETILNKRASYRAAFDQWDAEKIAAYDADKVAQLLANPGIVRNRLKVAAAITNAQAYLRLRASGTTLDACCGPMSTASRWRRSRPTARQDGAVGPDLEGPVQAGFQVRRLDHRVCLHAGHRHGERPCGLFLPPTAMST
jgi:3-methyladenine DNA glycosylase Tag